MTAEKINKEFWKSIQFLVIECKDLVFAEKLLKEVKMSKEECLMYQNLSNFENKIMNRFINDVFKEK